MSIKIGMQADIEAERGDKSNLGNAIHQNGWLASNM